MGGHPSFASLSGVILLSLKVVFVKTRSVTVASTGSGLPSTKLGLRFCFEPRPVHCSLMILLPRYIPLTIHPVQLHLGHREHNLNNSSNLRDIPLFSVHGAK
jgi:hypothetical protein